MAVHFCILIISMFPLQYVTGYFDKTTGSKVEKDSYIAIAKEAAVAPEKVVFFTDLPTGKSQLG